ncbi:MAG: flagellar filament capping protein FliD [Acidobacteria bacterium]|nr:flagellar filament capping protein FliD [Acidobacteriota bacterium]
MSSGITFSGFNNIDFNVVVNALMAQASQPLTALQTKQTALKSQLSSFSQLGSKLTAIQSAADGLSSTSSLASYATSVSDTSAFTASAGSSATPGHYDIVVQELARAQVTASASTAPDANTTTVADGGSLTINGKAVTLTGAVTLQGLAKAINDTSGIQAQASVVQTGANAYRLVLTGTATGASNAFTIQNSLTGGSGISFTDTDNDGLSGNSAADNAVQATDASLLVNNIQVSSASNTVSTAVPGTTLNLLKKAPGTTVSLDVTSDDTALQNKVEAFVSAYNALQKFVTDQGTAATAGNGSSIARDPLLRTLRNELRSALNSQYGSEDISYLGQIGVEFTRTGTLQLNATKFKAALANGRGPLERLLNGTGNNDGAFGSISSLVQRYTEASGFITQAQDRLNKQISGLDTQMQAMQSRLDLQRASLVREYAAADQAMTQLKNQSGALGSFGASTSSSSSSSN